MAIVVRITPKIRDTIQYCILFARKMCKYHAIIWSNRLFVENFPPISKGLLSDSAECNVTEDTHTRADDEVHVPTLVVVVDNSSVSATNRAERNASTLSACHGHS